MPQKKTIFEKYLFVIPISFCLYILEVISNGSSFLGFFIGLYKVFIPYLFCIVVGSLLLYIKLILKKIFRL